MLLMYAESQLIQMIKYIEQSTYFWDSAVLLYLQVSKQLTRVVLFGHIYLTQYVILSSSIMDLEKNDIKVLLSVFVVQKASKTIKNEKILNTVTVSR